jgi:general secretion pathway protein J
MTRFDGAREPVHVAYRLKEQKLELLLWKSNAKGEEIATPDVHLLIDGIEACRVSYLDSKGKWLETWKGDGTETRPQGVRVELQVAGRGTFERMFALL